MAAVFAATASVVPQAGWAIDLVANVAGHALAAAVIGVAVAMVMRRRRAAVVMAAACAVLAVSVVRGRPMLGAELGRIDCRVAVLNVRSGNEIVELVLGAVEATGADVVVLVEVGGPVAAATRDGEAIRDRFPFRAVAQPVIDVSPRIVVLSRWPGAVAEIDGAAANLPGLIAVRIDTPAGPLGVVAVHATSPRSAVDWRRGNDRVRLAASWAASMGGAVVVVGDFNATATGLRSRVLAGAGLRRAKPVLAAAGTWPAGLAWPGRLAIDGVAAGGGIEAGRWRTFRAAGSDHLGVVVSLSIGPQMGTGRADP